MLPAGGKQRGTYDLSNESQSTELARSSRCPPSHDSLLMRCSDKVGRVKQMIAWPGRDNVTLVGERQANDYCIIWIDSDSVRCTGGEDAGGIEVAPTCGKDSTSLDSLLLSLHTECRE